VTEVAPITGPAIALPQPNIDTDLILPGRYLKTITRTGLGVHAFETLRREADNPIDRAAGAPILIAGPNFGCGSSREHAAWALKDLGVQAVIAPGFADIFASNAFKNGIVLVALPQAQVDRLLAVAGEGQPITVDLETMTVTTPFQDRFPFELDPFRRDALMRGLDEIGLTLTYADAIAAYERQARVERSWSGV
jgi:3-isopropylmalate/(R)-2-methylmalate dehydratase small subunit